MKLFKKKPKTLREYQAKLIPKYIAETPKRECNLTRLTGDKSDPWKSR